jgi:hypothetical protein
MKASPRFESRSCWMTFRAWLSNEQQMSLFVADAAAAH